MILFASTSQVIGWEDLIFAPVKSLALKVISKMTYSVSSRTLNHTLSISLPHFCRFLYWNAHVVSECCCCSGLCEVCGAGGAEVRRVRCIARPAAAVLLSKVCSHSSTVARASVDADVPRARSDGCTARGHRGQEPAPPSDVLARQSSADTSERWSSRRAEWKRRDQPDQ